MARPLGQGAPLPTAYGPIQMEKYLKFTRQSIPYAAQYELPLSVATPQMPRRTLPIEEIFLAR